MSISLGRESNALSGADSQGCALQRSSGSHAALVDLSLTEGHQRTVADRFTFVQWRAILQQRRYPSPSTYRFRERLREQRSKCKSCPPDPNRFLVASCRALKDVNAESCSETSIRQCLVDRLGADAWLLVLLFSDTSTMSAAALLDSSCAKAQFRESDDDRDNEMGLRLEQLAAWLRSGMSLARQELPWCRLPKPPAPCHGSWLNVLRQQEEDSLWVCLLVMNSQAEFVKDFPDAIELASQRYEREAQPVNDCLPAGSYGAEPLIVVLPSVKGHRSVQERIAVHHPLSVLGLSVPLPSGPRRSVLWFGALEVCTKGKVELRNLTIVGTGTDAERPRGACDSVVRVTQGKCTIADSEICLVTQQVGFGVVAGRRGLNPLDMGRGPRAPPFSQPPPQASLKNCRFSRCTTGCMAYSGGQVKVDTLCTFVDCGIGISVCDRDSLAIVKNAVRMFRRCNQDVQAISGGAVHIEQ